MLLIFSLSISLLLFTSKCTYSRHLHYRIVSKRLETFKKQRETEADIVSGNWSNTSYYVTMFTQDFYFK